MLPQLLLPTTGRSVDIGYLASLSKRKHLAIIVALAGFASLAVGIWLVSYCFQTVYTPLRVCCSRLACTHTRKALRQCFVSSRSSLTESFVAQRKPLLVF
jgi:hypothetical protein